MGSSEINGYGYFENIDDLVAAVAKRPGDKRGGARVYEGGRIIRTQDTLAIEPKEEGSAVRTLVVRVGRDGTLNIRGDDSFDND